MRIAGRMLCVGYALILSAYPARFSCAGETAPSFQFEVNSDAVNVRSDSTVSSPVVCTVDRGEAVDVVQELYDWYKIRLPASAPSFIHKSMVAVTDPSQARVIKEKVNVRAGPDLASRIVGKVNRDQVLTLIGEQGEWFAIQPVRASYGWIHKRFVSKVIRLAPQPPPPQPPPVPSEQVAKEEGSVYLGTVKPQGVFFTRISTHKLVTADKRTVYLVGDKTVLDSFNYRKVRVTGMVTGTTRTYTIVTVSKIEALQ